MSLPDPINRKESYLAKIAGQNVQIPAEPITREEAYLDAIAKNSGGGSSYTCDVIFDTPSSTSQNSQPIIIGTEDLISSYDVIIIEASNDSNDFMRTSEFIFTKSIASLNKHYIVGNRYNDNAAITNGYYVAYDNDDCKVYTSTGILLKIYKVYAIKF